MYLGFFNFQSKPQNMKKIYLFLALCLHFVTYSQLKTENFSSKILGQEREICIYLPDNYGSDKNKKYPLLIVLDADHLGPIFYGNLDYGAYWDDLPEIIMVGINQLKDNTRENDLEIDKTTGLPIGDGEKFFEFIGRELIPFVEKNFRIAPFKAIAGHDLSAAFSHFYLYKEIPLFDGYISLSPKLATKMEEYLPQQIQRIQKPIYFYLATYDGDKKRPTERMNTLADGLKSISKESFKFKFDSFVGKSHYSLVSHAIPSALEHFFSVFEPISFKEYQDVISVLPYGYTDYLIKKYENIDRILGTKSKIRYADFMAIEAAILKNEDYNDFDALSILANTHYPKAMLADYYMALLYENKGEYKKAQRMYLKAFQMEPIGNLTKDFLFEKSEEMKKMN